MQCCRFRSLACRIVAQRAKMNVLVMKAALYLLKKRRKQRSAQAPQAVDRRKKRRGGWNPKPRHGDPNAVSKYLRWRHDSSKCPWWRLFDDDETYNERSWLGDKFYRTFHMPRSVFDHPYNVLRTVHGFADRHANGKKGAHSQPLILKWAACSLAPTAPIFAEFLVQTIFHQVGRLKRDLQKGTRKQS